MNHAEIKSALLASYDLDGGINHLDGVNLPSQESIKELARDCMHLLFPGYFEESRLGKKDVPGRSFGTSHSCVWERNPLSRAVP